MREAEKIWHAFERAADEASALQARAQSSEAALAAFREGMEGLASWHEELAESFASSTKQRPEPEATAARLAMNIHTDAAARIHALLEGKT